MNSSPDRPRPDRVLLLSHRRFHARSGFAMIVAVALVGLVAAVLAAMTVSFAGQARRTRELADETQLRQFTIAGALMARERLASWDGKPTAVQAVALPAGADDASLTLRLTPGERGGATAVIEARVARRHASQTADFARYEGGWRLVAVGSADVLPVP